MNEIKYRRLVKKDIPEFIEMRLNQLQEEGVDPILDLVPELKKYYEKHLTDGTFISWLAVDGNKIIGTSGMSIVERPPYYSNPSGKIGLLSSMYTLKKYRRKGISKLLLAKEVQEAKEYGCGVVQITASDMGVLLYNDFGFERNSNFMQFKIVSDSTIERP